MTTRMLIDARHREETRVAVTKGNRIEEFDFESAEHKQLKGNIYLAKVTRVEPSLQAAFVEYGGNRHGFLAFSEIHPDYYQIPKEDREAPLRLSALRKTSTSSKAMSPTSNIMTMTSMATPMPIQTMTTTVMTTMTMRTPSAATPKRAPKVKPKAPKETGMAAAIAGAVDAAGATTTARVAADAAAAMTTKTVKTACRCAAATRFRTSSVAVR